MFDSTDPFLEQLQRDLVSIQANQMPVAINSRSILFVPLLDL